VTHTEAGDVAGRSIADGATRAELAARMADFFGAVSFEAGGSPPYERLHDLFVPGGLLIRNTGPEPEITGVAEFIEPRQRLVTSGQLSWFEETELGETTEIFGGIAHRLSPYQKRGCTDGVDFAARGVISTQFVHTPDGWKITAMAWDDEPS